MKCSILLPFLVASIMALPAAAQAPAVAKSPLRVLYVGHDPKAPQFPFARGEEGRRKELYQERTAAFQEFLGDRFAHVKVLYSAQYRTDMSAEFDVTIFDARPKPITPSHRGVDPVTGKKTYTPATYLPEGFTHATLTISENSPRIGEPLGLKLDWL